MLLYFILFATALLAVRAYRFHPRKYPPGPPSIPLLGNARVMKRPFVWEYLRTLTPIYGDVVYLSSPFLGISILVLNSYEAAQDLLAQRAHIYSDRLHSTMAELMGLQGLAVSRYGSRWRLGRKLFHQHMNKNAIRQYWPALEEESRMFVYRLHRKPETFLNEVSLTITRIILGVTYNYRGVRSTNDSLITKAEETVLRAVSVLLPGRFLINVFPSLKYLPSWFPLAHDKRLAKIWREDLRESLSMPFEYVKDQRMAGTAPPSFALDLLEGKDTDNEDIMKALCASMYAGGAETTATTLQWFFVAMMMYPEAQRNAQAEIDRVVCDRLPELDDRDHLPYVDALLKELLRWFVMAPIGVPHRLMEDDDYKGYFIAKGTIILYNSWGISRNKEMYPNAEEFRPERFLERSTTSGEFPLDPRKYVFGFGRRLCPGLDFAEASMFLNIATILATTVISMPSSAEGFDIAQLMSDHSRKPLPFSCDIRPRSAAATHLVDEYVAATPDIYRPR